MSMLCSRCCTCENIGGVDFWQKVRAAENVLEGKMNDMFDNGMSVEDVAVFLENRMWEMDNAGVSSLEPERVVIQKRVEFLRYACACDAYRLRGWHKKHSGEWIKKERGVR